MRNQVASAHQTGSKNAKPFEWTQTYKIVLKCLLIIEYLCRISMRKIRKSECIEELSGYLFTSYINIFHTSQFIEILPFYFLFQYLTSIRCFIYIEISQSRFSMRKKLFSYHISSSIFYFVCLYLQSFKFWLFTLRMHRSFLLSCNTRYFDISPLICFKYIDCKISCVFLLFT